VGNRSPRNRSRPTSTIRHRPGLFAVGCVNPKGNDPEKPTVACLLWTLDHTLCYGRLRSPAQLARLVTSRDGSAPGNDVPAREDSDLRTTVAGPLAAEPVTATSRSRAESSTRCSSRRRRSISKESRRPSSATSILYHFGGRPRLRTTRRYAPNATPPSLARDPRRLASAASRRGDFGGAPPPPGPSFKRGMRPTTRHSAARALLQARCRGSGKLRLGPSRPGFAPGRLLSSRRGSK